MGVGRPVISPEKLAIGCSDADESLLDQLNVFPLTVEIDRDRGSIGRFGAAGDLALPDCFAGQFVQGHDSRIFTPWGADDFTTVNEWGFAVTPGWRLPAKIALQVPLPNNLAILDLQASQVATQALDIEQFTIDGRRASRPFFSLRRLLFKSRPETGNPEFLAVLLG